MAPGEKLVRVLATEYVSQSARIETAERMSENDFVSVWIIMDASVERKQCVA